MNNTNTTTVHGKLYGIGAAFGSAQAIYHAAEKIRDHGFKRWDVHSPFPIHGMDHAMGLGRSRTSLFSLLGGITGLLVGLAIIYYTNAFNYPLIVQGKPFFSLENAFPVTYEIVILLTAFATLFGMFTLNLLPRFNHPAFNWEQFSKMSDDGFFIIIETRDPLFSEDRVRKLFEQIGGYHISLIHHDP